VPPERGDLPGVTAPPTCPVRMEGAGSQPAAGASYSSTPFSLRAAWAADNLATGTLNEEQLT